MDAEAAETACVAAGGRVRATVAAAASSSARYLASATIVFTRAVAPPETSISIM
jgi:hypothetical protein